MLIKMLTTMAGPNGVASSGQEIDVSEKFAIDLVSGGYAVYTENSSVDPVIEEVVERPKQTAVKTQIIRKRQ